MGFGLSLSLGTAVRDCWGLGLGLKLGVRVQDSAVGLWLGPRIKVSVGMVYNSGLGLRYMVVVSG